MPLHNGLRIGLGCRLLGGDAWGCGDDAASLDTIKKALDLGITHFDTAQEYGRGQSEELLGRVLPPRNHDLYVATKLMYTPGPKVEAALLHSCIRLGREPIDLVYIHWPKKGASIAGMMEGLEAARRKGIIRHIGVSNFSIDAMQEALSAGTVDACQIGYSLLWRKGEAGVLPFCKKNGIAVVSYGSLAEGILAGNYGPIVRFPAGDHRTRTILFDQMVWPAVHAAVTQMKEVAAGAGTTLLQCAIGWLLHATSIDIALVGARSPQQVGENILACRYTPDDRTLAALTAISDRLTKTLPDEENVFRWYPYHE